MSVTDKKGLFSQGASTWFRGLAVVIVVLSHYAEWWAWFFAEEGTAEWIRDMISRMGPCGVAIFLLFSGYGLARSAGDRRIGGRFVLKRVSGVYLPYLIVVVLIELLSGGFETAEDVVEILYGQDFWYMTVLFSFYIAFMVIWFVFTKRQLRALGVTAFTIIYSYYLWAVGKYDFWYISNGAFAVGAVLALYEPQIKQGLEKIRVPAVISSGAGVIGAMCAFFWKWIGPAGKMLGKYSLYFYLSHTFLFMWTVNFFSYGMKLRFLLAAVITIVVSIIIGYVISALMIVFYHKVENIVDFKHRNG